VLATGALSVTRDASLSARSDITFITVGTPRKRDGSIDLTHVEAAARAIGQSLLKGSHHRLVVIKSNVTPGTARRLVKPTLEKESGERVGRHLAVCSNPEFLREGNAIQIHDTEFPDRIVIGSEDAQTARRLEKFYSGFHRKMMPTEVRTTHENAELIEYANNAFLAAKVSFINCLANVAERIAGGHVESSQPELDSTGG
jgi:UDPglucose 6-dehydrogenase